MRPRFWPHVYVAPMSLLASCLSYCSNYKITLLLLVALIRIYNKKDKIRNFKIVNVNLTNATSATLTSRKK